MTAAPISRANHSTAGEIARDDPMPDGPFSVGLMHGPQGALEWPFTIRCGDGRAIAGHVNSRACAEAIVDALNWQQRDAIGSYTEAVRAIGERVRAGEPVPDSMRSNKDGSK